ncbi:hypothetical protein Droror1_Dr00005598 [Drosera rotundifolia]
MAEPFESENGTTTVNHSVDAEEIHNLKRHRRFEDENGGVVLEKEGLWSLLKGFVSSILYPEEGSGLVGKSVVDRAKAAAKRDAGRVRDAARVTGLGIVRWTRRGGHLRALLVISVGTITLLSLTGLLIFLLFFVVATVNAIIISALLSLAAVGGFLALFFASLVAVYIGALSVAVFVISATTISTVIAVLVATGWIAFFWTVWLAVRKSAGLARKSINVTGSTLSAYSSAWHPNRHSHHHDL